MPSTYEPIATQTLGSAAASITFSSISSAYTDLYLVASVRNSSASYIVAKLTFNGDTGSNYSYTRLLTDGGSAPFSDRSSNFSYMEAGLTWGTNAASGTFTQLNFSVQNYSNTTTNKTTLFRQTGVYTGSMVGLWRNTNAINSLTIAASSDNWVAGSTFTLYGIAAA